MRAILAVSAGILVFFMCAGSGIALDMAWVYLYEGSHSSTPPGLIFGILVGVCLGLGVMTYVSDNGHRYVAAGDGEAKKDESSKSEQG